MSTTSKTSKTSNSPGKDINFSDLELNEEISEIMSRNKFLFEQNENLKKELREVNHNKDQVITELSIENKNLKENVNSLEELLNTYKSSKDNKSRVDTKKTISDLESKVIYLEQSEQNLKRKIQQLNVELSNLRLENEKLDFQQDKEKDNTPTKVCVTSPDLTDDLTLEEAKNLINEIMTENEELKLEKCEMGDKALNMLTEKEIEIMNLGEEIEQKNQEIKEILQKFESERQELRYQINTLERKKRYQGGRQSQTDEYNSNEDTNQRNMTIIKELQEEFSYFKKEMEIKESEWHAEKETLTIELEMSESRSKAKILDLEQQLQKVTMEISNIENDKIELTNELGQNSSSKNLLFNDIENYLERIKTLEEQKEQLDSQCKEKVKVLQSEMEDYENRNGSLVKQNLKLEKNLKEERETNYKKIFTITENIKKEIEIKDKEAKAIKYRMDTAEKENETIKKEHEQLKCLYDKKRAEVKSLSDNFRQIKDNYEQEVKKGEMRLASAENKFESEKNRLSEQLHQFKSLTDKINKYKDASFEEKEEIIESLFHQKSEFNNNTTPTYIIETTPTEPDNVPSRSIRRKNTLSTILDNNDEDDLASINITLQNEKLILINQINDLKLKLNMSGKQISNSEFLLKENLKYKSDIKELRNMYEEQIEELQTKIIKSNSDLQLQKRRLTNPETYYFEEKMLENSLENAEIKYLNDKIAILSSEIDKLKLLRENDIKFLKEETRYAEEIAVKSKLEIATLHFEKDTELLKYKTLTRRLSHKVNNYKNNFSTISSKMLPSSGKKV